MGLERGGGLVLVGGWVVGWWFRGGWGGEGLPFLEDPGWWAEVDGGEVGGVATCRRRVKPSRSSCERRVVSARSSPAREGEAGVLSGGFG